MKKFPTREELMSMTIKEISLLDVTDLKNEKLAQEVIKLKLQDLPPIVEIKRSDIPDIKTPQQEADWQQKIRERESLVKTPGPVTTFKDGVKQEDGLLQCPYCEKRIKKESVLKMHIGRFHKHAKA